MKRLERIYGIEQMVNKATSGYFIFLRFVLARIIIQANEVNWFPSHRNVENHLKFMTSQTQYFIKNSFQYENEREQVVN